MSLLGRQLDAFMAIVQYKTVHAAADSLHVTQTAVTQRIRALEQSLKTTLFVRTRKGMQLTQEGESLLHYCQAAKMLEGDCLAKIKGQDEQSIIRLNLSAPTNIMRTRIIPHCIPVLQQHPNLRINFKVEDSETRHLALKAGEADLVVIAPEHVSLEMENKALQPEKYLLVGPKAWAKRPLHDILTQENIIDFDPSDQMTFHYLRQYQLFEQCRKDRHYANNLENLVELVSQGIGYTVLTQEFYQRFTEHKQLMLLNGGKAYHNDIRLCWYGRPEMPVYFQAIIQAIQ